MKLFLLEFRVIFKMVVYVALVVNKEFCLWLYFFSSVVCENSLELCPKTLKFLGAVPQNTKILWSCAPKH